MKKPRIKVTGVTSTEMRHAVVMRMNGLVVCVSQITCSGRISLSVEDVSFNEKEWTPEMLECVELFKQNKEEHVAERRKLTAEREEMLANRKQQIAEKLKGA